MSKLTLEEQYLTLSQAKELQALGIDFSGANAWFCKCTRNWQGNGITQPAWRLVHSMRAVVQGFEKFEYIPILSVAEMIEMLPKVFIGNLNSMWFLEITCKATHKDYQVRYIVSDFPCYCNIQIEFRRTLIRDALFEMLKWLKQNKLM